MKRTIRSTLYSLFVIFLYPAASTTLFAQSKDSLSLESFIQQAASAGSNEVAMGNLGLKRTQNEKVKTYAEQLVGDHTVINADLSTLAKRKKIKLPDSMGIPINSMQTRIDTALESSKFKQADSPLKKESLAGDTSLVDFDTQYLRAAINDHQQAITLFTSGSKLKDPDVQTFCLKYLPVLNRHLEDAVRLSKEISIKK